MTERNSGQGSGEQAVEATPQALTRALMRSALKGSLATLEAKTGHPYASLVTVATSVDGTPLMLLSGLAVHTSNINADPRASLLFDGTSIEGDPLAGGRVSVVGRVEKLTDPTSVDNARTRFLSRHSGAELYAGFPDFAFYRLNVERAHFIGGFGRIVDIPASEILLRDAAAWTLDERDVVKMLNDDYSEMLARLADVTGVASEQSMSWVATGVDPEGLDIVGPGGGQRIVFPQPVANAGDIIAAVTQLVRDMHHGA